jgi:hypothetical protein
MNYLKNLYSCNSYTIPSLSTDGLGNSDYIETRPTFAVAKKDTQKDTARDRRHFFLTLSFTLREIFESAFVSRQSRLRFCIKRKNRFAISHLSASACWSLREWKGPSFECFAVRHSLHDRQTTSRRNSSREFPVACFRLAESNLYRGINAVSFDHSLHSLSIFLPPPLPSLAFLLVYSIYSVCRVAFSRSDRARKLFCLGTINANILWTNLDDSCKLLDKREKVLMILTPIK